jgi:hypothetical protein
MSLTIKDSRTVKLESLKKAKLAAKQTYDDQLLEKLQAADNKIKRSTLRGCYKEALLAYMRTKLGVKRLPKRKEGAESYHHLPRWSLIEMLVVDGIKDVRLDHKDLWKIRRGTKNSRPKKENVASAPSSQESVSSSSSSESMAVVSEPEPEPQIVIVTAATAPIAEEKPLKTRKSRRNAAKAE